MQRKIKTIISCIITACLTASLLGVLTDLMERKSSDYKYADFFEQEEDFDVLFLGTSHVINGVFPMELWNDYGIVSYNFGGHDNHMGTTYWVMENALDYTTPKVVVIDCLELASSWKCSSRFSLLHLSLDTFPLSITKIKTIWDLLEDPGLDEAGIKSDEPRTKIGLLWNYSVFHSRWNELTEEDINLMRNLEKGAESKINVVKGQPVDKIYPDQKMKSGTVGEKYLRKMIEDCQGRGIEVLLTYLPFPAPDYYQEEANYIYDIAEEYNVDYINFLDMELIDYQTDLHDEVSHVNPSGARKVTKYLGKYLVDHYSIPDRRDDPKYNFWNEDYVEYVELKNNNLKAQKDIMIYLMLLSGEDIDVFLDVQNKDIYNNEWILKLLKNIGVDTTKVNENTDFIIKLAGGDSVLVLDNFRDGETMVETERGRIQLLYDVPEREQDESKRQYSLYLNGEKYLSGNTDENASMHVTVYRSGIIVDDVRFTYTIDSRDASVHVLAADRDEKY